MCGMCREEYELNDNGLCSDCQETVDRGHQISQLAGRCANGAERDRGRLFHARLLSDKNRASWQATCGYEPGRRSVGWSSWNPENRQVTCKRCLKKMKT